MTTDWKADKVSDEIVRAILERAKPGGVIVLHDGRSTRTGYDRSSMVQALPPIIENLKARGFDFVTVPELFNLPQTTA